MRNIMIESIRNVHRLGIPGMASVEMGLTGWKCSGAMGLEILQFLEFGDFCLDFDPNIREVAFLIYALMHRLQTPETGKDARNAWRMNSRWTERCLKTCKKSLSVSSTPLLVYEVFHNKVWNSQTFPETLRLLRFSDICVVSECKAYFNTRRLGICIDRWIRRFYNFYEMLKRLSISTTLQSIAQG